MPNIRPSAYLQNNYNEISEFCHSKMEPIFITKNGHNDLAVMSIEAYEKFCGRYELYNLIEEGLEAERNGDFSDINEFFSEFIREIK
ncbi:MAG: type II toxin-antitoxin system Phd/YefM family antitoxin [Oscillospiraceae bacterium]|nr:type II toxin-antitoxin system Phd/YefM family antitoxin [Oscillospiraceae bacterium]